MGPGVIRVLFSVADRGGRRPWRAGCRAGASASELRVDPAHHPAQAPADLLDLVVGVAAGDGVEDGAADLVLREPLLGELAGLDLLQDRASSRRAVSSVMMRRPAREVAVLGGVGDRVAHAADALLVDQVHDQLQLVAGTRSRRGPGCSPPRPGCRSAARTSSVRPPQSTTCSPKRSVSVSSAKVVSITPAARAADALGVGQRELHGRAGGVLGHREQRRHAGALGVGAPHQVARALGGDHHHVDARRAGRPGRSGSRSRARTAGRRPRARPGAMSSAVDARPGARRARGS